jgi:Flp pilus assembly protein TadD
VSAARASLLGARFLCWVRALRPAAGVGAALARTGERPASMRYLEGALDLAPQKPELLGAMATALAEGGDSGRAEKLLRQRIALDPKEESGWSELGMAIARDGDVAAHLRVVQEAERAMGKPAMTLRTQHARLQLQVGDGRGAAATLLEMLRLRPELGYLDRYLREAYRKVGEEP